MPGGNPRTNIGQTGCPRLTMLVERRGKPRMIVSDNGTEFTSNAVLHWSKEHRVRLALHRTTSGSGGGAGGQSVTGPSLYVRKRGEGEKAVRAAFVDATIRFALPSWSG